MAKLNIAVQYDDLSVDSTLDKQTAVLHIADIVAVINAQNGGPHDITDPADLISTDTPNALHLGSDDKLVCNPSQDDNAPDFLAIYLLARG